MVNLVLQKYTVSDLIIDDLEKRGIKFIFGTPGASIVGLIEAIRKKPTLQYIIVRHEQNAAMAASAYNKLTGNIAVCLTITGPGTANLAAGLFDAKEDHASLISLSGQDSAQNTNDGGKQKIDQDLFFRSNTVYNNTITNKKDTVKILTQAFKYATLKHGAAQVTIPSDIQKESIKPASYTQEYFQAYPNLSPDDTEIEKAVHLINQAKNPVIIAGWGAYGLGEILEKLAIKINAPIVTTFRAKGILPETNSWVAGTLGFGIPVANTLLKNSDLLLSFGVGFSTSTPIPSDKPLIQVDIDPVKLGKHTVKIALLGNCKIVIPKIYEEVQPRQDHFNFKKLQNLKHKWFSQLKKEADSKATPIRPPYIMKILSEIIPENAIISIDIGDNAWWFGRNFIIKKQQFIMSGNYHAMGFALPGAIAAKIAFPEKSVICITGDGGFTMTMMDFITTIKYKLPIVVIIMNNKQYAMIQRIQKIERLQSFGNDLLNPDFAKYAEACRGIGYKVTKPEDLQQILEKAIQSNCSTILDIDTDPKFI